MSNCNICNGIQMIFFEKDGHRFAKDCECKTTIMLERRMKAANIPGRYEHVELENYETGFEGCTDTQKSAARYSKMFVDDWILSKDKGLIYLGNVGSGKTHLAIGVLKALIRLGASGVFYDQHQLLSLLRQSYEVESKFEESDVLVPAAKRDVLVLDDLGALELTEWGKERLVTLLNERYNNRLVTIITSNYKLEESRVMRDPFEDPKPYSQGKQSLFTLGDRVTNRMVDRLHQMCVPVMVVGRGSFRAGAGRAHS